MGGAGAAVCLELDLAISAALGSNPHYSNHVECEAVGVHLALILIQRVLEREHQARALILSDKKGVIQRLRNCNAAKPGQYLFQEIAEMWKSLQCNIELTFVWCPGHQGIQGNEVADCLAKAATERNPNPERSLLANLTKITLTLTTQLHQTGKKTLKSCISDLPIAQNALINQL
jgi:ribonuclease HI